MTRRILFAPLIAAAGLLLMAGPAAAHAEFVGAPGTLAPDSDASLVMNVPHERDDATYNTGVAIQLPAGWRMVSCQTKDTWTCGSAAGDGGRAVVRFTKADGAAPAEDETFRFVLHTGTDGGTFPLPTVQTYNTGEIVRWIEEAGGAEPAPSLTVSGSAPATTAAPVETTAATTATTEAPTTSAAPATTATPPTPPVAATTAATAAPTTAATTTTTSAPTTTTIAATTTSAAATTTIAVIAPAPTSSKSDGSNTGVIVLVVVLAGAGAAAGVYLAKRRPKPTA